LGPERIVHEFVQRHQRDHVEQSNRGRVDGSGGIYVADWGNNRVLHFPAGSATADRVYGQGGSFTSGGTNPGFTNANTLSDPVTMIVDAAGGLYVADTSNSRVLHFPSGSTTADRVYGQGGSFTVQTANTGGISANSLSAPAGLALDSGGGLYVGDYGTPAYCTFRREAPRRAGFMGRAALSLRTASV